VLVVVLVVAGVFAIVVIAVVVVTNKRRRQQATSSSNLVPSAPYRDTGKTFTNPVYDSAYPGESTTQATRDEPEILMMNGSSQSGFYPSSADEEA
jgi:hypothetical protein